MKMRRWANLGGGLGLYLAGLGFLGGVVAERVRFDRQRVKVIRRYDKAVRMWHAYLIKLEQAAPAGREDRPSESIGQNGKSYKQQTERGGTGQ